MIDKSQKVGIISSVILVGFAISVVFHYILWAYLKSPFPFNTFLFGPDMRFSDFTGLMPISNGLTPYSVPNSWINYFPLAYISLYPLSLIKNPLIAYFLFASVFLIFLNYMNTKIFSCANLKKIQNFQNIFIIGFLSYPVLYIIDRGNIDMFLVILFAGFIWLFKSEKYLLSAVLLGVQNAIKPFPVLFLLLFLFKKKYKEFFLSVAISAILVIGGFMFLKGNFFDQILVFIKNLLLFKLMYVYDTKNSYAMTNTSSLFTAMKLVFVNYTSILSSVKLEKLYNYLSLIILAITIFFTQREKIFWKKVTLLTLLMLLLPYIIDDYKLIFLFVPIWLFVNSHEKTKFDLVYSILFGLLMIPKKFFILLLRVGYFTQLTTFGIVVNPILMMLFIGLIIFEQFYLKKIGNNDES